jgi:hypothetical protein
MSAVSKAHWCSHHLHLLGLGALMLGLGAVFAALAHSRSSIDLGRGKTLSDSTRKWHIAATVGAGLIGFVCEIAAFHGWEQANTLKKQLRDQSSHSMNGVTTPITNQLVRAQRMTRAALILSCFAFAYCCVSAILLANLKYRETTGSINTTYAVCIPLAGAGFGALLIGYGCHRAIASRLRRQPSQPEVL